MRKHTVTIGLTVILLSTLAPLAIAQGVSPDNGFLQQKNPTFMNARPVPEALYPTLLQEVRAANLLIHQVDTLEIGSPEYQNAHRLLLQNLNAMQRQLHFNLTDLARFNGEPHPDRSTVDPTIYSPDFMTNEPTAAVDAGVNAAFSDYALLRTYIGNAPSRRSIVAAAEALNVQHSFAMKP